jgi:hypothetical protein
VDVTNGPGVYDRAGNCVDEDVFPGEVKLEIKRAAEYCECRECGNQHMAEPPTYKLPPHNVGSHVSRLKE